MSDNNRAEALAHLAALGVTNDLTDTTEAPAPVELSGDEVYAGGDVKRILIAAAHLVYRDKDLGIMRPEAKIGDTILLSEAEAKRLDGLGATATKAEAKKAPEPIEVPSVPSTPGPAVTDGQPAVSPAPAIVPPSAVKTDDELKAMNAGELVAHVNQNNGDKARVRTLEAQRPQPRATVMKATAPEGDDPDEDLD